MADIEKVEPRQEIERARSESDNAFVNDICQIIETGLEQVYHSVNQAMLNTYWNVGKRIIEEEQHGNRRAEYGKQQIKLLAQELVSRYGNSYNERNLYQFRSFYLSFSNLEILNERVQNLKWTHFRSLIRIENEQERLGICRKLQTKIGVLLLLIAILALSISVAY